MENDLVNCTFYERQPSTDGHYTYDTVRVDTYEAGGALPMAHPPAVGDLVMLTSGIYRVIERSWMYPAYGSQAWPHGHRTPREPINLYVIVERSEGMFREEAP